MDQEQINPQNPTGQSEVSHADISNQNPNPILIIQASGDIVFTNASGKTLWDHWINLYHGLPDFILKQAQIAKSSNHLVRFEIKIVDKLYLFSLVWVPKLGHINLYGTDISVIKAVDNDKLSVTRFDVLTQIANRQYFEEKLQEQIHTHSLSSQKLALILIKLDNLKLIEERLDNGIGARLLKAASKRIAHCIRTNDFIAQLGGDEFIILVNHATPELSTIMAEKIIDVLSRNFQFGEQQISLLTSIGISVYPDDGLSPSELLKHADLAMHQAKKLGKNNYVLFSKEVDYALDKRGEIIKNELKLAASKNELFVEYQPQIETNTGKIIGLEALLRWQHPEQGIIMPNEFFPIAEQTGCIQTIGQWLIERSLKDFAQVITLLPDAKLSINLSLSQLHDPRFLDSLCDNLLGNNLNREQIILDVSERLIAPYFEQVADLLIKIQGLGFKICLDNFASPQIALPKLLTLPIDYLKLDKQMILDIETSQTHRLLLKGILKLAKTLNIELILKGVETEKQHEVVSAIGYRYAQGHYYCQPVKINEINRLIKQS